MGIITLPWHAAIAMTLLGVGWASTLSIPFAMMANNIPPGKEGVMMGTFNIFIAAPQIFASALAGLLVSVTGLDSSALVLGGVSVLLAAIGLQTIDDRAHNTPTTDLIAGQAGH